MFAANLAGEALKQLAATTAGAQGAAGDTNFDQSLEQFAAMVVCTKFYYVNLSAKLRPFNIINYSNFNNPFNFTHLPHSTFIPFNFDFYLYIS